MLEVIIGLALNRYFFQISFLLCDTYVSKTTIKKNVLIYI